MFWEKWGPRFLPPVPIFLEYENPFVKMGRLEVINMIAAKQMKNRLLVCSEVFSNVGDWLEW